MISLTKLIITNEGPDEDLLRSGPHDYINFVNTTRHTDKITGHYIVHIVLNVIQFISCFFHQLLTL